MPVRATLGVQIVGLLVAVSVPLLALLGVVALDRNRQALTVDAQQANRLLGELTASAIAHELDGARTSLSTIGEVLVSNTLPSDEARFALAGAQLKAWNRSRLVTLYGGPTRARLGSLHLPGDTSTGPPTLPAELDMSHFAAGRVVRAGAGPGRPVLQVSAPVRVGGETEPHLWVYAELELEGLSERVRALAEAPPLRDAGAIMVVDQSLELVLAADRSRLGNSMRDHGLFTAVTGHPDFRHPLTLSSDFTDRGEAWLGALVTVPEPAWAVIVQQPHALAYQTLGALQAAVLGTLALAVVLCVLAGVIGARRLVRPLRRLVDAARAIGQRRFTRADPAVSQRPDEVGDLARAVDDMSAQLETSERSLVQETKVRAALSRYLADDVVELVVADPSRLKLGGEQRLVTVLFADVVGFTRLSEALPPQTIVAVLNELFTFATEIVRQQGGIVDKFIGDCVMAVWGVPESGPDDAKRALEAAEALRRWAEVGNRRWSRLYGVEVHLAMGLHTGLVVAGNVGSEQRMDYTVIGDTVNVAARLESVAAPDQILVSEETRVAAGPSSRLDAVGERLLRGRTRPTTVYELRP